MRENISKERIIGNLISGFGTKIIVIAMVFFMAYLVYDLFVDIHALMETQLSLLK